MPLNAPLTTGDGIKDFRNPVSDIVFHYVADKPSRQENTDHRIDQIKVVGFRRVEVVGQEILYPVDKVLQYQCRYGGEDAREKAQYQDELLFLDMILTPMNKVLYKTNFFFLHALIYSRIILMTPPFSNLIILDGFGRFLSS